MYNVGPAVPDIFCKSQAASESNNVSDGSQQLAEPGRCRHAARRQEPERALRTFGVGELVCPSCERPFALDITTRIDLRDPLCSVPLESLGLARDDLVSLRREDRRKTLLLSSE